MQPARDGAGKQGGGSGGNQDDDLRRQQGLSKESRLGHLPGSGLPSSHPLAKHPLVRPPDKSRHSQVPGQYDILEVDTMSAHTSLPDAERPSSAARSYAEGAKAARGDLRTPELKACDSMTRSMYDQVTSVHGRLNALGVESTGRDYITPVHRATARYSEPHCTPTTHHSHTRRPPPPSPQIGEPQRPGRV